MGFVGPGPAPRREPPALTDGHVVAAVRESRVPVAELGLVAAASALGLTGHWVGHGCEGGGPGSAGSPTAPPGPHIPAAPSSAGQSGRGHQAAHGGDTTAPPLPFHHVWALTAQSVPIATASCTSGWAVGGELLQVWGRVGATSGRGEPCAASSTSAPGELGSRISRGLWGAIRRHLSSKPGRPGEGSGQVPGTGRVPVIPPLPFTLSCISNCILLALRRWRCWGPQRWPR